MGGGASLKGFDFSKLKNRVTIACNRALNYLMPDYLVYMDDQFYDWYEEDVRRFKGEIFTHSWNKFREGVTFCRNLGPHGISDDFEEGLFHGGNAAYLALNLAYVMGGDPIYLLGVDMCYLNGRSHFHDGYDKVDTIGEKRFLHMKKAFNYSSELLKERGVRVYNCSDISRLTCFKKMDLGHNAQ
ncbi:hypothetical protein ACFL2A_00600 [Thermodesulfobacteriota bacterium]